MQQATTYIVRENTEGVKSQVSKEPFVRFCTLAHILGVNGLYNANTYLLQQNDTLTEPTKFSKVNVCLPVKRILGLWSKPRSLSICSTEIERNKQDKPTRFLKTKSQYYWKLKKKNYCE